MKRIVFLCAGILMYATTIAQTSYTLNYTPNAGNPGALNTDHDTAVIGWTTIIGSALNTNTWSPSVALPFTFNYYGNPVNNFRASANGLVTFSNTSTLPNDNVALPSSGLTDSTIACFWDAFTTAAPTAANDVVAWKVWGTAPNRQLWIKWASFEIGAPAASNVSFMCMLEETTDKIYLVEGTFATSVSVPPPTTTAGIQLNNTTALMYGSPYRTRVVSGNLPIDNNVLTFTPYTKTNMAYASFTTSQPNTNNVPKNGLNEAIMRIDIDMTGELTPLNLTQIALNTLGTTTNADITNARVFYSGTDSNYSTTTQFGSTATSPSGAFTITGTQALKMGRNYFWVTYSVSNSAVTNNIIDITCATATIGGTPYTPLVNAPIGSRTIKAALSGTVPVGSGNTYVYLSDVFNEINVNGLSGNTTLSITSDITDIAVASLTYGGNYTLKIVPSADVVRNITSSFPTTLIELSGTKNVIFEGKGPISGTGKYLRFINKDTLGSAFTFSNGSRFDTIRNCVIEGATTSQTKGVIHLGTSTLSATGIRDIQILNNDIRDRSDSVSIPTIMIYSSGTTDFTNGNITISGNNIFNYRRSAVYINSGNVNDGNYTISNNSMYYNASTAPATGDVVSIMFIPGAYSENNLISGNYIGGQSPLCAGSAWLCPNPVNWVAMNINAGFSVGTSIQGNTIQNINLSSTANVDFVGIRMETGKMEVGTITGNTIGHATTPNSIIVNTRLALCIYSLYGAGNFTIGNNLIANIYSTGTRTSTAASALRGISIQAGGALPSIYNNTIYNLTADGTAPSATTSVVLGIGMNSSSEVGPISIKNNLIYNIIATHTTANTVASGIVIDNGTINGIVEGNRIYNIQCLSTSTTAGVHGLYIQGSAKNWIVRNNTISITNGSNTNDIIVRGISDNAANNTINYFNNTVYIGGTLSGISPSFAFERRAASILNIRNNIFYNERTGGTGVHAAIANVAGTPASNWNTNTSSYNLLVAQNAASVGYWGTAAQTFAQWQSSSTGDKSSWSDVSATVPSATFFKNVANGDLSIDSSNVLCWYANGKGIALVNNSQDMHGQSRSVSITTGAADIGADEFPTTTLPPFATISGAIAGGDSSIFTFAGRTIAKVIWNSALTPSTVSLRYYTGTNPPAAGAQKYFNSYYEFTATNAGVYSADVKLMYDSALFGKVSTPASLLMANYVSSWNYDPTTIVNIGEQSFRMNNVSSINTYTGTDPSHPLPVELVLFNGVVKTTDANLFWQSASELNAQAYEVERSYDGKQFESVGSVKTLNKASKYEFIDFGAFANNATAYYRLKMLDNDGTAEYSNTIILQTNKENTLEASVYPNPYTSSTSLSFNSTTEEQANVTIIDIQGKTVWSTTITTQKGTNSIPLDLTAQKPGMYFVTVSVNGVSFQTKIIK